MKRSVVLNMLLSSQGGFVSGEDISRSLNISRTAVWKYINELKEMGYVIESHSRTGYKLIACPDVLWPDEISLGLDTSLIGREIVHFLSIGSTNDKAKELANNGCREGLIVVAEEQTGGRGRLGRRWVSPQYRGIWMSVVLRPDIQPIEAQKLTLLSALAVSNAIEDCIELKVGIKWPNDLVISGKKICGILTEMSAEVDKVNYVIIGIGINANISVEDIPDELKDKATSLAIELGYNVDRKNLFRHISRNIDELYTYFINGNQWHDLMVEYREKCINVGRRAVISQGDVSWEGMVTDIDDDGALIVLDGHGEKKRIISGDVSIRGVEGYV
ncbi:MAG: BirA family transcriptional regulator [Clostridiales bacterium]|nr:BirA family transcriptional regulator [Clostridiales bacterium]